MSKAEDQMRVALEQIREKAATMHGGGAWAAGIATLCLGTLPEDDIPVYALAEAPARNALRSLGEVSVPPNATAEELKAIIAEMHAVVAKALK